MNMRPKTKRRLLVLILGVLVLGGSATAIVVIKDRSFSRSLQQARKEAWPPTTKATMPPPSSFWQIPQPARNKTDAEALFAYAKSRSRVELPDQSQIWESINLFTTYRQLKPDDLEAQHILLRLYAQVNYFTEALELAQRVLEKHPNDAEALRGHAWALLGKQQFDEALLVAQRLNDAAPTDLQGQILTYTILASLKRSPQEMLQRASTMREAHPDQPQFELLEAHVRLYAADVERNSPEKARAHLDEARQWLRKAAAHPVTDVDFRQGAERGTGQGGPLQRIGRRA